MFSKRFNKRACTGFLLLAAWLSASLPAPLFAQETPLDPNSSVKINIPGNSPVSLLSLNLGDSRATARGSAMVLDLHMTLSLRNTSGRRVRGVTLLLLAQEMTPFGKGSVAVPSLDVAPGEAFQMPIEVRLMRPLQSGAGPLVEVSLDGVLFQDLGFFGPDRLNSRRSMTFWETEAQRDRKYFKQVLQARGLSGLQQEMLDSLARQAERPRLDVTVSRTGRATSAAASSPERVAQFAFLHMPDSPVSATSGWAEISGNEVRSPRIQIVNQSSKPVRYVEIGWLVKDHQGREFLAGSVPASDGELYLPPGQSGRLMQDTALRFTRGAGQPNAGQHVQIQGMTGFVSQVEYSDGSVWVPRRESLESSRLMRVMAPSPEEQKLSELYRTKGLTAVIEELKMF